MPTDRYVPNGDSPGSKPFQFSLRSLLVVMTLAAIFLSCLFGGPAWVASYAACLVSITAPVVLVTILVYGRDYQRTFCIEALMFEGVTFMVPY